MIHLLAYLGAELGLRHKMENAVTIAAAISLITTTFLLATRSGKFIDILGVRRPRRTDLLRVFSLAAALCLIAPAGGTPHAEAATVIWDGGGVDEDWQTAENWSGDQVPSLFDEIVFNGTSSKACSVDVPVSVTALTVDSGYAGTLTFNSAFDSFGDVCSPSAELGPN